MTQPPEGAEKKGRGRPTKYTKKVIDTICTEISKGRSLRSICTSDELPHRYTIMQWLLDESKRDFYEKYAIARQIQAECLADELQDIADDGSNDYMDRINDEGKIERKLDRECLSRSRLRVDTRKWYLSKVLPKVYGDALRLQGDPDAPVEHKHVHEFKSWDEIEEKLKLLTKK